ncbi:MAG TPA: GAF domain-containing protein [Vicinamibacterales bacterium]
MSERCEPGALPLAFDALRETEVRLRLAIDASGMGTFIWRADDNCIEPDARMRGMLGLPHGSVFPLSEIIARSIHPIDRERCRNMFARAIEPPRGGSLREEIRVLGAGGSVRWLEIRGETIFLGDASFGSSVVRRRAVRMSAVANDITDRKRREDNLALLDQIADGCARASSADEIMQVVGPLVGARLRVSSVCLFGVDEPHDQIRVLHIWNRKGSPARPDVIRISDFVTPEYRQAARSGNLLVVHDTNLDPRTYANAHETLQVRSFLTTPFIRDGAWKFVFSVCDARPHRWRDEEVTLFRQIADRVFARLEQALAEQAVASDLRDTQLLRDLSARLVAESDTQAFFDAIVAAAMSITNGQAGCLQLLDGGSRELVLLANQGFQPALVHRLSRVNATSATSCGQALATNSSANVDYDAPDLADPDGTLRLFRESGIRSAQSTPLITRAGRTVGMLCTKWAEPQRQLSEREARFLDLLARQAAEFIERRLSENALRESERRLSIELADTKLLQHLSAQLIEGQGSERLYETVVDAALWIMRSDYATMQVLHPGRGSHGELRLIASRGLDEAAKQRFEWVSAKDATTCARALQTKARVIAPDLVQCEFMAGSAGQAALLEVGIRASQTTPLISRSGTTLGMMSTHWSEPHQPSERDFRLLDILARQAADLIERSQAGEALRESERQLKEADRRKDEFLATLAHELRNPLAPLRTSLELIRIAGNSPDVVEEVREEMEEQLALLVRLVDDLLDVSRITSGKIRLQRQTSELATLVTRAVQANRTAIDERQIDLSIDMPNTRVLIESDPVRFVQVISNVLHNAVKFSDPGGRITISAQLESPDTGTRQVTLRIADSGIGISSDMLPRVFDLFAQDDATSQRSQTGLGIGLALARRLIEMHGGSIEAHSDGPSRGSTFTLRMPVAHLATTIHAATPPATRPCAGRRVLVIDDNAAGARAMQRLVKALGGECRVAHNGETGLTDLREYRPDIVILDIGMPGLDGYETCRRIRQEYGSSLMVVALTGWGQERDKDKAMQAGFDMHLTKPADPTLLEGLLATAGRP